MSFARDNILSRLHSTPTQTNTNQQKPSFFALPNINLQSLFATNFAALGGIIHHLDTVVQLPDLITNLCKIHNLQNFFCPEDKLKSYFPTYLNGFCLNPNTTQADASLTSCHALIAQYGSILLSSQQTRQASILPHTHIVIASTSQLVFSLAEALPTNHTINSASIWSIITGASRTADIEKTLVMGAHGPKSLHLILFSSL